MGTDLADRIRAHGSFDNATIETCLQDDAFCAWAALHLTDDTLLSQDELDLYAALQDSGKAAALEHTADRAVLLPVRDATLRDAVAALDRSTAALRKQTDTLQRQLDAVARLVRTTAEADAARAAFADRQRRHGAARRDGLRIAVAQLERSIDAQLGALAQQGRGTAGYAQHMVDGLCRDDDRLLASLQKLGRALVAPDGPDADNGQLRDVCLRLIQQSVELIRTRLDRVYLEAAAAAAADSPADAQDVQDVQEALESLYAEILPVAQMAVDQRYLGPALQHRAATNRRHATRALLALDYMDACLDCLCEQVALLTTRIQTSNAHQTATAALVATARAELAVATTPPPQDDGRSQAVAYSLAESPVRRRRSLYGAPASPVRRRRRSSGLGGAGVLMDPLDQLLQSLSLTLPVAADEVEDEGPPDTATRANACALQATLAARQAKAEGVAANGQEAYEQATAVQMADGRRAVWLARESVLAESAYGAVQLRDPEIDGSMTVMADAVEQIRARLDGVGAALAGARQSAKRDAIVARWG